LHLRAGLLGVGRKDRHRCQDQQNGGAAEQGGSKQKKAGIGRCRERTGMAEDSARIKARRSATAPRILGLKPRHIRALPPR